MSYRPRAAPSIIRLGIAPKGQRLASWRKKTAFALTKTVRFSRIMIAIKKDCYRQNMPLFLSLWHILVVTVGTYTLYCDDVFLYAFSVR